MAEFEKELAVLKGRVDGLEAKVGELEANQFSTTTKLNGIATFVVGGASNPRAFAGVDELQNVVEGGGLGEEVTFNYDVRLNFDTSFTGKDLLRTTLRAGNFADSVFGNGNTLMEVAFEGASGEDSVEVNRLFYQFPIGEVWTATVGAKVRQDDMLAMWPSAYPADTILDIFTYGGAQGAYSLNTGAGVGLYFKADSGFNFSANFVSNSADAPDSFSGLGEGITATAQLGYAADNWGAAFVYTYTDFDGSFSGPGLLPGFYGIESNSIGLSAYWSPMEASWFPSISTGFGYNDHDNNFLGVDDAWSWMVGLQWADAFLQGNALGMAIGSAGQLGPFSTASLWFDGGEENLAYELWYKFQVTDNISVTPAFFWIENTGRDDTYGGLLKTTFKF
jgi:hypothetical protein